MFASSMCRSRSPLDLHDIITLCQNTKFRQDFLLSFLAYFRQEKRRIKSRKGLYLIFSQIGVQNHQNILPLLIFLAFPLFPSCFNLKREEKVIGMTAFPFLLMGRPKIDLNQVILSRTRFRPIRTKCETKLGKPTRFRTSLGQFQKLCSKES